jgi:hypothetical protein
MGTRIRITNNSKQPQDIGGRWVQPGASDVFDADQVAPEWRAGAVVVESDDPRAGELEREGDRLYVRKADGSRNSLVEAVTGPGGGNRILGRYDSMVTRPRYPAGYTKAPLRSNGLPLEGLDEKTCPGATVTLSTDSTNTWNGEPVINVAVTGTPTGSYFQIGRTTADFTLDTDGQDIANRSILIASKLPAGMPAPSNVNVYISDASFANYARYACPFVGVDAYGWSLFQKEVTGTTQLVGTLPSLSGGLRTRVRMDFAATVIAGEIKVARPKILPLPAPTVIWTNDDGYDEWTWLAAEARKRSLDLSFGVSYSYVGTEGYLNDAGVHDLQDKYGHEVTNHAGPNTSYLESDLATYMGHVHACTNYLRNLGIDPKTLALHQYVKGHEDATLRAAMKAAGFVSCRATNTGYKAARAAAFAAGGAGIDGLYNIPNCINLYNGTDLATVKTQLTAATKIGAAFIVGHRYEAAAADTAWINSYDPTYGVLGLMDWLQDRRDIDGWQIKTWRQWYDDLYDAQAGMTV